MFEMKPTAAASSIAGTKVERVAKSTMSYPLGRRCHTKPFTPGGRVTDSRALGVMSATRVEGTMMLDGERAIALAHSTPEPPRRLANLDERLRALGIRPRRAR
jgi:hypothetical protein